MRAFIFCALLLFAVPAQAADKDKIVGTWKLVSVTYEDTQTKELTPVLGEHPRGYQIATPEGRRAPYPQDRRGSRQGTAQHDRL
jgi:hypothetical protein